MRQVDVDWEALGVLAVGRAPAEPVGVPCAARPATRFRHLDGPCRCFVGGPPPVYPSAGPVYPAGGPAAPPRAS